MEVGGEVNEVHEFFMGAGGSPDAAVNIAEEELGIGPVYAWYMNCST